MLDKEDSIATIILNRPEVRNALNEETLKEILSALKAIEDDEDIDVIILLEREKKHSLPVLISTS